MQKFLNGELVNCTPADIADVQAKESEWAAGADVRASEEVRTLRDELLASTDWTANTDVTMTADMTAYRQALRDIPAQDGFPNTVTWPVAP
jgi:hypothetical protein|tara:strand:- start:15 stop:287 length:273 start_codon:yes stop_codon:yes gene_type:complete